MKTSTFLRIGSALVLVLACIFALPACFTTEPTEGPSTTSTPLCEGTGGTGGASSTSSTTAATSTSSSTTAATSTGSGGGGEGCAADPACDSTPIGESCNAGPACGLFCAAHDAGNTAFICGQDEHCAAPFEGCIPARGPQCDGHQCDDSDPTAETATAWCCDVPTS